MDLTQGTQKVKKDRAKKMMLWFGIVSLLMGFAGWTSAYIVSRSSREDWISDIQLPDAFLISTAIIVLSSITYIIAKRAIQKDNRKLCTYMLVTTLFLGVLFIVTQFQGFRQMLANGYFFTGPTSSIKMSYVFLIAAVHIAHLVAGIISLLVVLYKQVKGRYSSEEYLGVSLGATFWHFLDLLWVYLMLFMSFVQ
ncbi:heme-copper oxidase subunit III [Aggregatimonas sangjinii]|uniref:Heme-copper oxidase subunit III n=1 Tax=Aggregatimonas sangjinii TaxID=2583587 RepID=A0A5B7SRK1_9FLAO|nr:cytochrome c oxidase subunit 3 [Aggregatimonas sangjinii]QCX01197.1 heme-copper oxidase subunit III [Aggregatimonas sangjinii]